LRELPLESGDIFSKSKLTAGLRNLYNLQFFSMVAPQILPGSENNLVDLIINVEEQSTTSLEFGLTFSGVTESNKIPVSLFAKWQDSNVAGTGKTLSAQLAVATDQQSVSLGYSDSWFLGLPLSFSLSGSFYHKELTTLQNMYLADGLNTTDYYMDYTNWTTSVGASLGRRWTPEFAILTLAGGISFNLLNNVYDPDMYTPVDTTISEYNNDWGWTNSVWSSFSIDDRNINYDPTKGWFASQRLAWTGLIPAIEDQFYLRSDTKLEGYWPLVDWAVSEHWSLQLILAGYTGLSFQVPSANTSIGATNQLYIDGMFNGRGWGVESGVKGQAMWSSYVELRWPFVKGMLAADFFVDAVALKDTVQDLSTLNLNDFRFSFGPGLRIAMPQFPLRFLLANTFYFKDGQFTWREDNKADWQFVLSFNIVNK
jgi:outer membrane protein insertion porin family